MTPPRPRHPRPDANQAVIIEELRKAGFCVHNVSSLSGNLLDLFIGGYNSKMGQYEWVQVEVKIESGALTDGQQKYLAEWPDLPIIIARSADDILQHFGHRPPKRRGNDTRQ